ncbi:LCP family protein [Cellulomonas marina]|uniref:LCP family protein n=1 Tax=Cellulomonas marina TaxID=988821 RepID=UPI001EF2D36B|nr:LCP family protein [Cellulomonas marina]
MTSRHVAPRRPRALRHARARSRHPLLRGAAVVATGVLAFAVAGTATVAANLQGNITSADVSDLVVPVDEPSTDATPDPQDASAGQALDILVMGSDERDGENAAIGGSVEGMRSDTTILVHVSADRSRAQLVSIPRDSLVEIPACTATNGQTSRPRTDLFNSAFATGADMGGDAASAAACAISAVQVNTGVTVDHYVVVDFVGFTKMVDALGGVTMCIPEDMSSPMAGLQLSAGVQTLDGTTALAFARARKGVGDGSDTSRLGRQQQLLAATLQGLLSKNFLTDTGQLIGFFDAATESLTTDPGLSSIADLTGLAFSLRGIDPASITFLTIPFGPAPSDPNRVVWTPEADAVWAAIAADQPLPSSEPAAPAAPATTDPAAPADPAASAPAAPEPTPTETKAAGQEAFTGADVTAVCS